MKLNYLKKKNQYYFSIFLKFSHLSLLFKFFFFSYKLFFKFRQYIAFFFISTYSTYRLLLKRTLEKEYEKRIDSETLYESLLVFFKKKFFFQFLTKIIIYLFYVIKRKLASF